MKKILVPTDFSEHSLYALETAYHIAQKTSSSIVLIHVVEDTTVASVHYTGEVDLPYMEDRVFMLKLIEKGKQDLADLASNPAYEGVNISTELRIGNPYHNIKDIIAEHDMDLVVMGTKGSSGLEEFLIGSNAEKVVRHAKCPVLTIHKKLESVDFKNIVYATALDEKEAQSIKVLNVFRELYGAEVTIVKINTPNNFQSDRVALKEIADFAENNGLSNCNFRIYNEATEEEGILYFAEEIDADLIVMATHGRTGLAHMLGGSIAEDVVNHAKRPVLTYVIGK